MTLPAMPPTRLFQASTGTTNCQECSSAVSNCATCSDSTTCSACSTGAGTAGYKLQSNGSFVCAAVWLFVCVYVAVAVWRCSRGRVLCVCGGVWRRV